MAKSTSARKKADIPEKTSTDLDAARRVLGLEQHALQALADSLDGAFQNALDILQNTKGRVIVTGMGKSGHVGRKIAATLSSTGTPAFFVHPGEASHGDLGMISKDDSVLALSNSGETPELSDVVSYTRRFSIPLVVITARANSALAQQSSVALFLPNVEEACPMGLAPTTSTTMSLALGDAIAVALMERKGFSPGDYKVFHPGGPLAGRTLKVLRVADVMHDGAALPLTDGEASMSDVLVEMTAKSFGCIGVVKGTRLIGIITDGDLRRHMSDGILKRTAAEVMTPDPKTIRPGALASEAVQVMNDRKITNMFVSEDDAVVGIIHIHDCLRAGVI